MTLGIERYGSLFFSELLRPTLFSEDRFFDLRPGDTFYETLDFSPVYEAKRAFFSQSRFVGDKIPLLFRHFPVIRRDFPDAKIIFCLRNVVDVAISYQRRAEDLTDPTWHASDDALQGVSVWNDALDAYHEAKSNMDIKLFDYDLFLSDGGREIGVLMDWLGLDREPAFDERLSGMFGRAAELEQGRPRTLTGATLREILRRAAIPSYQSALAAT